MDLSLRDLAERCGVRRRCSPRSSGARPARRWRSPPRSPPASSCRSPSCCGSTRATASPSCAPDQRLLGGHARRPPLRGADAAAAGPARRGVPAHARRRAPPPAGPATRRSTRPAAARPRSCSTGRLRLVCDGVAHDLARGRRGHLRRRPSTPLREPRPPRGAVHVGDRRRPEEDAELMPKTMFEKIWEAHEVRAARARGRRRRCSTSTCTSCTRSPRAQAFEGLRLAGPQGAPARSHARDRRPQRPHRPARAHQPRRDRATTSRASRSQALEHNCDEFGIPLYGMRSARQGIVHVIGPELGLSQPGHHDRLRRLAHLHARRARRARDAGRHVGGRARARDPVPAAGDGRKTMRITYEGEPGLRRHRRRT